MAVNTVMALWHRVRADISSGTGVRRVRLVPVEGVDAVTVGLPEERGWGPLVSDLPMSEPRGQYALITEDGDELWRGWV